MTVVTSERTTLSVVVTGDHAEIAEQIGDLESPDAGIEVLGRVAEVTDASVRLSTLEPHAVLHCATWPAGDASRAITALGEDVTAIRRQTAAPIILLVSGSETDVVDAALAAGVDDVLLLPQRRETIVFAVRKAAQAGRTAVERKTGTVITVFSPKGGTGKTVLATNVAAYLASKSSQRVLLIDLDLQFGDAAIMLGLDPARTMFDLVQAGGDLDAGKLVAYTTRHKTGLDVLVAPMLPEHAELVTEQKVVQLVQVAREAYDIVVIDTSPFFYGPMLALLRETDQLLMLCGLDVPTLKNVRLSLRTLELLGFPRSRTRLVLNRVTPDVGLTARDVEEALGVRVSFEVPNDPIVAPSVNQGAVPSLKAAESVFANAIAHVAAEFEPTLEPPAEAPEAPGVNGSTRLRRFVARRHLLEGRT